MNGGDYVSPSQVRGSEESCAPVFSKAEGSGVTLIPKAWTRPPPQAFPRALAQQRAGKVLLEVGLEKAEEVCAWEVSVGL